MNEVSMQLTLLKSLRKELNWLRPANESTIFESVTSFGIVSIMRRIGKTETVRFAKNIPMMFPLNWWKKIIDGISWNSSRIRNWFRVSKTGVNKSTLSRHKVCAVLHIKMSSNIFEMKNSKRHFRNGALILTVHCSLTLLIVHHSVCSS